MSLNHMEVYYKVNNDGEQESYQEFKQHFRSFSAFLHTSASLFSRFAFCFFLISRIWPMKLT